MGKVYEMISRRNFFSKALQGLGLGLSIPLINSCSSREIPGKIVGANAKTGHLLRDGKFPEISEEVRMDVVIVGGGVSGLSAARYLSKHTSNFRLLELDNETGGNARGGINGQFRYPWGAHYLPLPGNGDPELVQFLSDSNVITGVTNGLPVYNEYFLCHDPKERLYINNFWQEGLIPQAGVPAKDRDQINGFLSLMQRYKEEKGRDGKMAFTFPVIECSSDKKFLDLDLITASEFLRLNAFDSPYLHWYVNYCCADDYGSSSGETSAWAMIHYFASRRGLAANAPSDAVLTWPEGNFWLIRKLRNGLHENILTQSLAYNIDSLNGKVQVSYYDVSADKSVKIAAEKVIMATPQFVNQRLLGSVNRNFDYRTFQYSPWMTANIKTTHPLNERRGEPLSWDNVVYGSDGLGYINAAHQETRLQSEDKMITYYKPLLGDSASNRRIAYQNTFSDWKELILKDLSKPHPDLARHISEIEVWIWGHGMIKPVPGFQFGADRTMANRPINNQIFFAHSDISGLSVFEEAFYNGHAAAKAVLKHG
jgi:hypothetical protein